MSDEDAMCRCGHQKRWHVMAEHNPACTGAIQFDGPGVGGAKMVHSRPCPCPAWTPFEAVVGETPSGPGIAIDTTQEFSRCSECSKLLEPGSVAGVCESCAYVLWGD